MTSHREHPRRGPMPNWLKAWYATLIFISFIVVMALLLAPEGGS